MHTSIQKLERRPKVTYWEKSGPSQIAEVQILQKFKLLPEQRNRICEANDSDMTLFLLYLAVLMKPRLKHVAGQEYLGIRTPPFSG